MDELVILGDVGKRVETATVVDEVAGPASSPAPSPSSTSPSRLLLQTRAKEITFNVAVLCGVCGLVYLVYGVLARPYTEIEAQIAFQVDRIQHHLPLYTDPFVGAWEAGAPPSRFHVLYPPAWVELLARFPTHSLVATRTVGRVIAVSLLLVSLAAAIRGARPENRRAVFVGAMLTLGLDLVVRGAGLAQADVPAIALATLGLARAVKKGKLDVVSAALLASAPFVKHSVIGMSVGAFVAHVISSRKIGVRAFALPLASAALVGASFTLVYHFLSGGTWLVHIMRATGQALSFERWQHEVGSRIVLLGLPHAIVLVVAVKRRTKLLAVLPFVTCLAWTLLTLAKHGSSTHYWLEPSLACLVTVGAIPPHEKPARALPFLGLALAIFVAISSLRAFAQAPAAYATWQPMMDEVRRVCPLAPGQVVMSNDVRVEVEINGRVIIPAWESSHMARTGEIPLDAWRQDLVRPEVRCLVTEPRFFDPLPTGAAFDDVPVYRRELRDTVEANFVPSARAEQLLIWTRVP